MNLSDLEFFFFSVVPKSMNFGWFMWCVVFLGGESGGKAKPLKQPKADKKEYDEV